MATRGVSDCLLEGSEPVSRINFTYDTTDEGLVLHLSRKADDGGGSDEDDGGDGEGGCGESDDSKIKRLNDTIEQLECEADQDARGRLGGSSGGYDADARESKEGKGTDNDGDSSELASDPDSSDIDNDEEEKTGGYERPVAMAFTANPVFSGNATGPNFAVPVATALTPRDDDIVTLSPDTSSRRRVVVTLGFVPIL